VDESQGEDHPDVGFSPIGHNATTIP
jgi:hypothetical protein